MILAFILYLCGFNIVVQANNSNVHIFHHREQKKLVLLSSYKSVRIFNSSLNFKDNCEACQAVDKAVQRGFKILERPDPPGTFNPALSLCQTLNGRLSTIYDIEENEISVCLFSDQSFYFSWDLYKLL